MAVAGTLTGFTDQSEAVIKHRQLTQTQRYQISALRVAGKSQRQIAAMLGCHNSTIIRELRRNSIRGYEPEIAYTDACQSPDLCRNRRSKSGGLPAFLLYLVSESRC